MPAIVWMVVIFMFSANDGDKSTMQSDKVSYMVAAAFDRALGLGMTSLTYIVRKTAHFTEYLILGCLLYLAVRTNLTLKTKMVWKKLNFTYIIPAAMVFIYACSDELHQYFVPGRCSSFKDVMIDTAGGVTGLLIIALVRYIHGRIAYNKANNSVRRADNENM